jgi:tRNA (pseudouridine54-N1)-methyltransferase
MRRFVILGHTAAVTPEFSLNDLPGGAGRMDVLCRAVGAAFFLSHDLRRDVEVILLLQNKILIRLVGNRLRHLNPDERSTAALLKHALEKLGEEEVESTPGIFISPSNLTTTLDRLVLAGARPIVLHEEGTPFSSFSTLQDPAFFLSDHLPFTDSDESVLADLPHVSLGRQRLHTSQCITIVHHLLDQQVEGTQADLVLCHKVWGEPKAMLIKGLLEDFNIPVNLVAHVPQSVLPMTIDGLAEVRIMVRERDLSRAKEIIAEYFEEPTNQ